MKWFKHKVGSHDDPDISDAWDELGDFGYVGFFVILELYADEYNNRDSEDFMIISQTFLRRKLRKSWTKVELLLNFFSKRNRIVSKSNNRMIWIKVPKFIELMDNWTERKLRSNYRATTEKLPNEVEEEVEEDINTLVASKKKTQRAKVKFTDDDMRLAKKLDELIKENNSNRKKPSRTILESWANEVRLMREVDKRTHKQIESRIDFSQYDHFWCQNILSMKKLRKQYDQLTIRMKTTKYVFNDEVQKEEIKVEKKYFEGTI